MKLLCGLTALACVPVALAGNRAALPKEKIAEFVAEKLDVTTLPSSIRPKPVKRKKTFGDYGYMARLVDERQINAEATPGGAQINIRILEQKESEIYVCVEGQGQNAGRGHVQRVALLKLKNANGLLKGRESWKEFDGCPVIGGADRDSAADSYGGG
jgi:hypothetical protein